MYSSQASPFENNKSTSGLVSTVLDMEERFQSEERACGVKLAKELGII